VVDPLEVIQIPHNLPVLAMDQLELAMVIEDHLIMIVVATGLVDLTAKLLQ
jgi:hypothetical protein